MSGLIGSESSSVLHQYSLSTCCVSCTEESGCPCHPDPGAGGMEQKVIHQDREL
jgi:hypothetical protein